ncbi:hypothetical protein ACFY4C_41045 [Actinomadura viridis]|uniref:hypothetical protein n=1 Tax=Actinomadura viridis TaxID=58110 RepID=UPI0036B68E33
MTTTISTHAKTAEADQARLAEQIARAHDLAREWTHSPDITVAAAGRILQRTLDGPGTVTDLI